MRTEEILHILDEIRELVSQKPDFDELPQGADTKVLIALELALDQAREVFGGGM